MKAAVFREKMSGTQLDKVFKNLELPVESVSIVDKIAEIDLTKIDLLVMSMDVCTVFGALNGTKTKKVPDFVADGGICWILHQEREGWDASWLPQHLRENLRIDIKYLPKTISFRPNSTQLSAYIGPWITERNHQIFHKPNFLDETDFAEWDIKTGGLSFKTTAINAITRHHGWNKIAGYEDIKTPLKKGALIMEARYGKGLYFWTQILSPGFLWHMKNSREKETWAKFLTNIFQYFSDFKNSSQIDIKAEIFPWSINAGEKANVKVKLPEHFSVSHLDVKAGIDNGGPLKKISCRFRQRGKTLSFDYIPYEAGTHRISAVIFNKKGNSAYADLFLKVTKGITRYRFTTHHHYCNDWVSENLGQVYGSARRWNQDAIFLASGLFYQPKDMYQIINKKILKKIDNPRTRVFPGQEIHPHHHYGRDEGNLDETIDSRRHIATMGCETIICDANYLESDIIKRIHEKRGLAIVAHPNPADPWWTEKMEGHICDGVCIETKTFKQWAVLLNQWDRILKREKGVLYPAVRGCDSGPGEWHSGPTNTVWLREPVTMQSLMKAAVNGRISFLYPARGKFETVFSYIWFDIEGQLMGGTIYAVNKVNLNIKAKSHFIFKKIKLVKDGNNKFKIIKGNGKNIDLNFSLNVMEKCCYYRLEGFGTSKKPGAWTNPIFVRKVKGPENSWFYFDKDPEMIFDRNRGRYVPNCAVVENMEYKEKCWNIKIYEPEQTGIIKIGGVQIKNIIMDGNQADFKINTDNSCSLRFPQGKHSIKILLKKNKTQKG
jgi:hypothetical protein